MSYAVKEMFLTLQGEGVQAGRRAVFVRFAGCNLWSGREDDRAGAVCKFCDTDFVGGERMTAPEIAAKASDLWGNAREQRFLFVTGGEPLLQADWDLVATLHRFDFMVAAETNGTIEANPLFDWITVSPKAGVELKQRKGDELKLVYPQVGAEPDRFADLKFAHRFIQPMDGPDREANTKAAVQYCLDHPGWRLSLQTHKILGIP